ncbi:hypothetical protein, conserved [Leishmania tarentolae]|uniref:Uncharacterized protein n=1 Tax=Leishmania tarentolae TaxID=5689 RepID=A0A640KP97_LEITA|nr:hypothetical protein, conserved [Leishmania tarentolae]
MTSSITPVALPSSALLNPKEAAALYESVCRSEGVFIQSTFLKQLLLGSVIIQFENGYLGESGVGPIIRTLQRAPLRTLLLTKCALSTEDMKMVCMGLAQHPQLEKIDIRGVPLTIAGAKELLHLVARNTRITEVLMDNSLPKYVAIQQQCNRNAEVTYQISECMICGEAVPSKGGTSCETLVIRLLLDYLKPTSQSVSVAGLRVLCGAWQECLDRYKGVLAVCPGLCAESLAEDLCRCVSSVTKALVMHMPYKAPNLVFLRSYLTREHMRLQAEEEQTRQREHGSAPSPPLLIPGPVDAVLEEQWRTKRARTDIDVFFKDDNSLCLPRCTVCGCAAECSQDGPTWLLRVLQKDITEHGAVVTPVALIRLWRLFGLYANLQPCSRRCVRHLVRYGLYGYGGVNCSYASGHPPLSSVVGGYAELQRLPLVNFSVVNIEQEVIEDVCGGELNCALTVASALGDEEGTPMDPYLLFAIGRQLRQQSLRSIGMDLPSACEAARLVGCLPASEAPFKYHGRNKTAEAPPRDLVADWATWSSSSGEAIVRKWLHRAFAHRRQRVCVVDGPHRDLFDNIRAALWTLRQQPRPILVTVKFSVAWLSLPNGVVPHDASVHTHGVYTTAKVIGQSTLHNTMYAILQLPFGNCVGHKGFFYLPKTVFLQIVRGLAFVFLDAVGIEYRSAGPDACVYGYELVRRPVGATSPDALSLLRRLLMCLMVLGIEQREAGATIWGPTVGSCDEKEMRRLFSHEHLPAPLQFVRSLLEARQMMKEAADLSDCRPDKERRRQRHAAAPSTYWERVLVSSRFPSQLLFFFSELIGTQESFNWLQEALRVASAVLTAARDCVTSDQASLNLSTTKQGVDFMPFTSTSIDEHQWIVTVPAPSQVDGIVRFSESTLLLDHNQPASAPRLSPSSSPQRRSVRREQMMSSGPKFSLANVPKPPSALPSGNRKRSTPRQSSVAGSARKKTLRAKSAESQASEEWMNTTNTASTSLPTDSRLSLPFDKNLFLIQLQRKWAEERATRQEALQAASSVGILEFVRAHQQHRSALRQLRKCSKSAPQTVNTQDVCPLEPADCSEAPAAIPARLLGKSWLVVPFPEVNSNHIATNTSSIVSDTLLLFIGDTVSAYSQRESRLLCGPVTMCDDPLLVDFPFRTGVDAAVTHPTQPHLVFFFSGREWLLFDFHLGECVDGPYAISRHGQFRRLPSVFHDRLDGVLHIPHTQLLIFFRDYCYVVFDFCTRRCVDGMGFLDPPSRETPNPSGLPVLARRTSSNMPPALEGLIRTVQQTNATAQNAKSSQGLRERSSVVDSDADEDAARVLSGLSGSDTTTLPLLLSKELQGLLGTAPMTAFCARSAESEKSADACYVVSRTGVVIPVCWQSLEDVSGEAATEENGDGGRREPHCRWLLNVQKKPPTTEIPLQNLPLLFRQFTAAALATVCQLAVETECSFRQFCTASSGSPPQLCVFYLERQAQGSSESPLADVPPRGADTEEDHIASDTSPSAAHSPRGTCGEPLSTPASTTITSSLLATALGERVPLALSYGCSAQETDAELAGSASWHDEVLFYGNAEAPPRPRALDMLDTLSAECQSSFQTLDQEASGGTVEAEGTTRVSFIEYDLGASSPQRIFTALLLILDTSAVPPSLLQLSSLVASVESSADGKMYFSQALVRITGPIVAARWGSGPGSVTSSAARFWRLRFSTQVPASLGFVRLFWMETASGSFAETQLPAPTMFSPCIPVTLTLPLRPRELTAVGGDLAVVQPAPHGGKSITGDPLIIGAEELFQASTELLSTDNFHPVFADDPSRRGVGWFVPHAVLPELGSSSISTCVFICASSVLQLGWSHQGESIASTQAEAEPMVRHTGFREIPYPFGLGCDAAFYIAPREHPGRVAFLRGDWMLLWDLHEQRPLSDVMPWRTSVLLGKLGSLPIATIIAVINCWSSDEGDTVLGVFHIASSLEDQDVKYVEFDLETGVVLDLPVPLAAYLMDRFRASPPPLGITLHTVLCTPDSPSTWHMFWDRSVQTVSMSKVVDENSDAADDGAAAVHVLAKSRLFYPVSLYLSKWGQPQHHCSILIDVPKLLKAVEGEAADDLMITGMQLCSAGGRDGERTCWQVQCSEDGSGEWRDVTTHYQIAGARVLGETLWAPSDAYALGKCPYWRFSRVASSQNPSGFLASTPSSGALETAVPQSYSQLRLLTVPRQRCRRVPMRISGDAAATPVADIKSFFESTSKVVTLSLKPCGPSTASLLGDSFGGILYELIWDYGSSPMALCSIAFEPLDTSPLAVECTWTIWHSSTPVGPGMCSAKTTKRITGGDTCGRCTLSWLPDGPYRYWRLQCEWRTIAGAACEGQPPSSLKISAFSAHEYDGPLITVYNEGSGGLRATPLLWPMAEGVTTSPYQLRCVANSVLQLMNVAVSLTLWETEFFCERGSCTVRIAVESTNDARQWSTAAETTINTAKTTALRPQLCSLSWPSCGAHVYWRLRVLESSADVTLHLTRLRIGHCPAASHISMFAPQPTSNSSLATTAEQVSVSMLRLSYPRRMVRVRVLLPNIDARYHVEYLGPDGTSWLFAALMDRRCSDVPGTAYSSNSAFPAVASVSWDGTLVTPSTHWRLRPLDEASLAPPRGVEWFERSSEYAEIVDTTQIPGMIVNTTGFTEVQLPSMLNGSAAHNTTEASKPPTAPPMPVLQCTAQSLQREDMALNSTQTDVTWSFISPLTFHQVLLFVQTTVEEPATSTAAETPGEESSRSTPEDAEVPSPAAPVMSPNQPLQQVLVETSDNGQDYVAIAETTLRLCDKILSLRWEEVPSAVFWRLRFVPRVAPQDALPNDPPLPGEEPFRFTLSLHAARWLIRRGGHALLAQVTKPTPGRYSNTILRSWTSDAFNREGAFMRSCVDALGEYKCALSQSLQKDSISRQGQVAGTVQKMKHRYQNFLLKAIKEAEGHRRVGCANAAEGAGDRSAREVLFLFPPSASADISGWLSKEHLSSDIIYLLAVSAKSTSMGGSHMLHLAELLHHPLAFREAMQFTKRSKYWFYPCLEAVGPLADDWYGFPASSVCASLSVFWSLSTSLQRQLDALLSTKDMITPLSEHVASPLVVVSITESNWVPLDHFPNVALFLYALGFNVQPLTVAFAINDVVFTPPYALGIPSARDSRPLVSPYPYMIAAGVNFVQQCPLARCPAPVMDVLRYILPASAFALDARGKATQLTTLVLNVSSLNAGSTLSGEECTAVLRFTVSGSGVNFGLPGLVMDSIEFEVLMRSPNGVHEDCDAPAEQRFSQMNFVSHGARFVDGADALMGLPAAGLEDERSSPEMELPLSLMGAVDSNGLPLVSLRGDFGNTRFTDVAELPGAVVTHLQFTTLCHVEDVVPMADASSMEGRGGGCNRGHWVFTPLEGEGQVRLPGVLCSCTCACTVDTVFGESTWPVRLSNFHIAVDHWSIDDLEAVLCTCRGDERERAPGLLLPAMRKATAYDVGGLRVEVAATLRVLRGCALDDQIRLSLKGTALLTLENTAIPDATLEVDCGSGIIALTARCVHSIVVGAILVEGCSEKPILIQILRPVALPRRACENADQSSPSASPLRFMLSGYARFFSVHHRAQVTLELSQSPERFTSVTLVAGSLRHSGLVVTLQDCVVSEVWRLGQLTINERALRDVVERDICLVPIIATLQAHQIPLALTIASIAPEPYDIVAQRLSCRLKGRLYGASFDVVTSVVAPDDSDDLWSLLGAQCIPAIVEQCEANLWASYANVVGVRQTSSDCRSDTDATVHNECGETASL